MKNMIKKLSLLVFLLLFGFVFTINANATTIKESVNSDDKLNVIADGTIIIGITKFDETTIVTADRAVEATFNYMNFVSSTKKPTIYYFLANNWLAMDKNNNPVVIKDKELIEELNIQEIYYVNDNEKTIELPLLDFISEEYDYVVKNEKGEVNNRVEVDKVSKIVSLPATTKNINLFIKKGENEVEISEIEINVDAIEKSIKHLTSEFEYETEDEIVITEGLGVVYDSEANKFYFPTEITEFKFTDNGKAKTFKDGNISTDLILNKVLIAKGFDVTNEINNVYNQDSISVDWNQETNVITVSKNRALNSHKTDAAPHDTEWYSLMLNLSAVKGELETDGDGYTIEEIDWTVERFSGINNEDFLIWLDAKTPTRTITFKNANGEELNVTIKVIDNIPYEVEYSTAGEVVLPEGTEVTYKEGKFIVPGLVKEFKFTDGDKAKTYKNEKISTDLILNKVLIAKGFDSEIEANNVYNQDSISVDWNQETNVITVSKNRALNSHKTDAAPRDTEWYSLMLNLSAVKGELETDGDGYTIEEIDWTVERFSGINNEDFLIWLDAKTPTRTITFKNANGEELNVTIKVIDNIPYEVEYSTAGEVVLPEGTEVTYKEGKFIVPGLVKEFKFTDGDKAKTYKNEKISTDLILNKVLIAKGFDVTHEINNVYNQDSISVDWNQETNVITVSKNRALNSHKTDAAPHDTEWYSLMLNLSAVKGELETDGDGYTIEEIDWTVERFSGINNEDFLIWLDAKTPTRTITFKTANGEKLEVTIKVIDNIQETEN